MELASFSRLIRRATHPGNAPRVAQTGRRPGNQRIRVALFFGGARIFGLHNYGWH
jgi:hypothetical protein